MPGQDEEIGVQSGDVHRRMRDGLSAVDQYPDPEAVRDLHHLVNGRDSAQSVGDVRDRREPRARAEEPRVLGQDNLAVRIDRRDLDNGARLLSYELPRHDIGVVLQYRQDNLVARIQQRLHVAVRHEVYALRRSAYEDDVVLRGRPQELGDGVTRRLVGVRGAGGQFVRPPVDVGVLVLVEVRQAVYDLPRFLRGRSVVEPYQLFAVAQPLVQDGKVRADAVHVEPSTHGPPIGFARVRSGIRLDDGRVPDARRTGEAREAVQARRAGEARITGDARSPLRTRRPLTRRVRGTYVPAAPILGKVRLRPRLQLLGVGQSVSVSGCIHGMTPPPRLQARLRRRPRARPPSSTSTAGKTPRLCRPRP
ncbi:hypothetical protein R80B4_01819 [Fibrobacteres bacterium R8-0-B4]